MIDTPAPPPVANIQERLKEIFPEGTPNRSALTWEIAAKTVFVMLYIGAVDGNNIWMRPDQVTRMTDAQAEKADYDSRAAWLTESMKSNKQEIAGRWYAGNTREPIRDDTIRAGFIAIGVVVEKPDVATTSPHPRYALKAPFAALFDPNLKNEAFKTAAANWRQDNLNAGALARITIRRKGAVAGGDHVLVTFPSGETRRMATGDSSVISKAVIEVFAKRYLQDPGVIFLSDSRNKVVQRDNDLAGSIGLRIEAQKNLPDIILADLGPEHPLLVFVEVVATDGPVSEPRREALLRLAQDAGFPTGRVAFVTAYLDRSEPAFKKTVDRLAWSSFAWFASEPDGLIRLYKGQPETVKKISEWD